MGYLIIEKAKNETKTHVPMVSPPQTLCDHVNNMFCKHFYAENKVHSRYPLGSPNSCARGREGDLLLVLLSPITVCFHFSQGFEFVKQTVLI